MGCLLKYLLIALLALALTPTFLLMVLFSIPLLAAEAISGTVPRKPREFGAYGLGAMCRRVDLNRSF